MARGASRGTRGSKESEIHPRFGGRCKVRRTSKFRLRLSSDRGSLLETGGISGLSAEALSGGRQRATRARQQETWSGEAFGDASRRKLRTRHPEEEADRSPVRGTRSWKTLREECFWRFAAETSSSDLGSGGDFRAGDAAEQPAEDYIVRLCRWCLI